MTKFFINKLKILNFVKKIIILLSVKIKLDIIIQRIDIIYLMEFFYRTFCSSNIKVGVKNDFGFWKFAYDPDIYK